MNPFFLSMDPGDSAQRSFLLAFHQQKDRSMNRVPYLTAIEPMQGHMHPPFYTMLSFHTGETVDLMTVQVWSVMLVVAVVCIIGALYRVGIYCCHKKNERSIQVLDTGCEQAEKFRSPSHITLYEKTRETKSADVRSVNLNFIWEFEHRENIGHSQRIWDL